MTSVDTWVEHYRNSASHALGAGLPWLNTLRERALDRFVSLGWPHSRQEGWRHTSLRTLESNRFSVAAQTSNPASLQPCIAALELGENEHCLVFVDGRYHEGSSHIAKLPQGVELMPLSRALQLQPEAVEAALGNEEEGFSPVALNKALLSDGAYIALERGVALEETIHLVFVSATEGQASFPHNIIVANAGSRVKVVEHYLSLQQEAGQRAPSLNNAVTHAHVGRDAHVTHIKFQSENEADFHLAYINAKQEQGSSFHSHSMSFGARLARNDIHTRFNGEHCETLFNGLYYANGRRHVDHHTLIDHAQAHGKSREYYRGILDDNGRGVFGGRVLVAQGADGTDSIQRSDSLLLSRRARADSKPELEIYADDVQCAHGATVGQIDENSLFYLRSRGLDESLARNILTYAFAAEVISRLEVPSLSQHVNTLIRQRLPGGTLLGELA